MEISVTRALAELKLTDKKINQKTEELRVATVARKSNKKEIVIIISEQQGKLQSINDLIKRRDSLKVALVASNAETIVSIGGKLMCVASAIERKNSISFLIELHRRMRDSYYVCVDQATKHNEKIEQQADQHAEGVLQGQNENLKAKEVYEGIRKIFVDNNKTEVVCVENCEKMIEKLQDEIDEFESEVDFILSESNTKTMIEV